MTNNCNSYRQATVAKRRVFFVYLLIDDRTGSPFYVGKSHYIQGKLSNSRLNGHLHDARDGSRNRVHVDIRAIWRAGGTVSMRRTFESHSERKVLKHEKRLIAKIGLQNLSNNTPGGDGFAFCISKADPAAWTKHRKKRAPFSKQWLKRLCDGQKRKWQQVSSEQRARWTQAAANPDFSQIL